MRRRSFNIYYYGDQRPLILEGIQPAGRSLRDECGTPWFFTRHWLRGPHVSVSVEVEDEPDLRRARHIVHERLDQFLSERPSSEDLDPVATLVMHARLAELDAAVAEADERGRLTAAEDSAGNQTRWEYDNLGNLLRFVDASGNSGGDLVYQQAADFVR